MDDIYWLGSKIEMCDICQTLFEIYGSEAEFVYGATAAGLWAIMCPTCFQTYGRELGLGRGQLYKKQPDGRWKKVAG